MRVNFKKRFFSAASWVSSSYFAEGLPFTFLRSSVVPAFLKQMGASLETIGFTSLLGIPYTLKFLWSPFVDLFWKKRHWTIALQTSLFLMLVFLAFLIVIPNAMTYWWIGFFVAAFLSATQDIAIDGFYLEALDESQQALYAGLRIAAYRVSMIVGSAIPLMVAGKVGWFWGFLSCAILFGIVLFYNLFALPKTKKDRAQNIPPDKVKFSIYFRNYIKAFSSYLLQERIGVIIVFMLFYKLGDALLFSMNTPFLLDLGVTTFQLGWLTGTVGKISSIFGSIFGGWWVAKRGLKAGLWQLGLVMNVAILAYVGIAILKPGLFIIAITHSIEQIAAGVGTTAFAIFQMRTCNPQFKAAHYAIATSVMAFAPMISGPIGGYMASHFGYDHFFIFCFLASIPGFLLILFLPDHLMKKRDQNQK